VSKTNETGVRTRHSRSCPTHAGGECTAGTRGGCRPSYEAFIRLPRRPGEKEGRKDRATFHSPKEAAAWRRRKLTDLERGKVTEPSRRTLSAACEDFLAKAERGEIVSRHKTPYKPSVLRGYRHDLETFVLDDLGAHRLAALRRRDFQALVDRLLADGKSGQKVRNIITPLQTVYRHARRAEEVAVSPVADLDLPAASEPRDRSIAPEEAQALLDALPDDGLRAIYATAYLAGLRRGELRALRWEAVDFDAGTIAVRESWDDAAGPVSPKSRKGTRRVPMGSELRRVLAAHKLATGRDGADFVFGSKRDRPFTPSAVRRRAETAWKTANAKETKKAKRERRDPQLLSPAGLHEFRHGYVSWMFDAGLSLERIGDYCGHASSYMTSAYRHLLDGHEAEAARLQDEYLARRARTTRADARGSSDA
jgi:integrase